MVTRNDERVTCHLSGLDQRDRRASAEGILGDIKPRNGGNEFGISCDPLDSMESHWMASASQKQVARAANGQFRPGVSGNLSGNVHRSRHALNSETIREMHVAFRRGGRKAIDHVMKQQPKVEHSNAIKDLTDEQLEAMIEYLKASLEAKAQGTNVTGGEVLDAAALPAPETTGPAPDVVLDDKPKQPNKVMEAANTAIGPMRALRTTRAPSTLREILEAEK